MHYDNFEKVSFRSFSFVDLLAECGVTHVRIRVWNDPYDSSGRTFGGGHNDPDDAGVYYGGSAPVLTRKMHLPMPEQDQDHCTSIRQTEAMILLQFS